MANAPAADGLGTLRRFRRDFREGLQYIISEKGLLVITLYFMVSGFAGGGADQLHLPFFRNNAELFLVWALAAETLYAVLSNFGVVGRAIGGVIHYKVRFPVEKKFLIALTVYTVLNVLEGVCLWLPVPLMAVSFFVSGLLGVTSFNIRISATQSYIPDGMRGRFNGTFQMLCSVGGIAGSLVAGTLAEFMTERWAVSLLAGVGLLGVYFLMYRGRHHVAAIYNRKV